MCVYVFDLVLGQLEPPANVPPDDVPFFRVGVYFFLCLECREEHARVEEAI